ncbi:hypothetical protein [Rhizobium leguminosarum]|uniref:hypothetical protein n=1 Tax=Rhizobium leguminosarum TaxID=384 RepID=UPI003F9DF2CC
MQLIAFSGAFSGIASPTGKTAKPQSAKLELCSLVVLNAQIQSSKESERAMKSTDGSAPVKKKLVLKIAGGKILTLKKQPANLQPKALKIAQLVASTLEVESYVHGGFQWANRSQEWWVEKLGFSLSTFRRETSKPPFVRECIVDKLTGKKVALLRIGVPAPKTKRHVQNIMSSFWRNKTGRRLASVQYGHLAGMVDHWGLEKAVAIFKLVINEWSRFMVGVHMEIALLGDEGKKRYYNYPSTAVILRFWTVGVEMYIMDQQAKLAKDVQYGATIPF